MDTPRNTPHDQPVNNIPPILQVFRELKAKQITLALQWEKIEINNIKTLKRYLTFILDVNSSAFEENWINKNDILWRYKAKSLLIYFAVKLWLQQEFDPDYIRDPNEFCKSHEAKIQEYINANPELMKFWKKTWVS